MPTTDQSIIVDAPVADVWSRFINFHDLSWPGARRILNNVFHETLIEINSDKHFLRYSIDDGPSPVSKAEVDDYVGVVSLKPSAEGNGTLVGWTSSWESKSDDAVEFCHGIYVALLGELANSFKP